MPQKIKVPKAEPKFHVGDKVEILYQGRHLSCATIVDIHRGGIVLDKTTMIFGRDGRYPGYNKDEPYLEVVK